MDSKENEIVDLGKELRKDQNVWRCADSNMWDQIKDTGLLSFNWLDPSTNYQEINLDSLEGSGKDSIKRWVRVSLGDLIFIMDKNNFYGIAIAKGRYDFDGPFLELDDGTKRPAIEVEYLYKLDDPAPHQIETHNNPATFAGINQYNFSLSGILVFLDEEIPEAIEVLKKFNQDEKSGKIETVTEFLLQAIEKRYPNFKGFTDPRFIEDEINYKQKIIKDAKEKLSNENLSTLMDRNEEVRFYERVKEIGEHPKNNLLFRGVPSSGDLALLHDESLNKSHFMRDFYFLLHGRENSGSRLDKFCEWVEGNDLPNKWTFATYYLFVTNPSEELFVKPTEMKEFLELLGKGELWQSRPTGEIYQTIKEDLQKVGNALPFEVKRGFLDLQSFLWSAIAAESDRFAKAKSYLEKFSEVADSHFAETDFLEPWYEYFQDFTKKENLEQAEWGDFQEMGKKVHALSTNALAYGNAFGNPNHNIERYRKAFLYLAYGNDPLSERINAMLDKDSEYYLKYLGKSFYSELVGYLFPEKYVFYNKRDEEAIAFLGLDIAKERGEAFGDFFLRYNEGLSPILDLYKEIVGQRTQTTVPLELDQFFSWLYEKHVSKTEPNYWWLNADPDKWQVEQKEVGEEHSYTTHTSDGNSRRFYKNFEELKPGDLMICYETKSSKRIKAILEVTDGLYEDGEGVERITFEIKQFTPNQPTWSELQSVPELQDCDVLKNNQGSLFSLAEEEYKNIYELAFSDVGESLYEMDDALREVFMQEEKLQNILDLLKYKKNIILQGPPGTGKTFLAKRLAWLMSGIKDTNRIEVVQFHQSYSYEDFIRGYRPTEEHFKLKDGIFMQMCKRAKSDPENKPYFLVIDEINRGNLSKIFGELMMLIENDKRGKEFTVKLPYRKDEDDPDFYIPKNLHLIGTMNTADRSLAMVDYALRRRFVFIDMMPNFGDKFQEHLIKQGVDEHLIDTIVERLGELNKKIADKQELGPGPGYQIGHSYFCGTRNGDEDWYKNIIRYEIIPLLNEYWFDKSTKVDEVEEQLLTI